jgi:GNAT superfamily N-acetyltransferase
VQHLAPSDVDLFFDLLQEEGVAFPAEKRAAKRGYYCTAQFRAFIVRDERHRVCGWTMMFVDGTTAFFGNSFTLPAYRRTGVHAALLVARLNEAAQLGLAAVFTDVEFGSHSHDNCERAGLRTLTVNTIWIRG